MEGLIAEAAKTTLKDLKRHKLMAKHWLTKLCWRQSAGIVDRGYFARTRGLGNYQSPA
jgi:hypothetical protein